MTSSHNVNDQAEVSSLGHTHWLLPLRLEARAAPHFAPSPPLRRPDHGGGSRRRTIRVHAHCGPCEAGPAAWGHRPHSAPGAGQRPPAEARSGPQWSRHRQPEVSASGAFWSMNPPSSVFLIRKPLLRFSICPHFNEKGAGDCTAQRGANQIRQIGVTFSVSLLF